MIDGTMDGALIGGLCILCTEDAPMPVTVDHQPLAAETMGLRTLGQVLAHVQRDDRLVVSVLIDGQEPNLQQMSQVRNVSVLHHALYIETADRKEMALEVLDVVRQQLADSDRLRAEVTDLLGRNENAAALERLSGCFSIWQHAQDAVLKTARLLRIDLELIAIDGRSLTDMVHSFRDQLGQIKAALEARDFVLLSDTLTYEMSQTASQWQTALDVLGAAVRG
jgi:hypothetical protein